MKEDWTTDPVKVQIHQEVEEFLRDLTLEFPLSEIVEILRRYDFKDRFGQKVAPIPKKGLSPDSLKELQDRTKMFLKQLRSVFGEKHQPTIEEAFRFYTQTTQLE